MTWRHCWSRRRRRSASSLRSLASRSLYSKCYSQRHKKCGAAGFCHAQKGHAATPYKRLKQMLSERANACVIEVGECNTSQVCSCCHGRLKSVKGEKFVGEGVTAYMIHGIKVCPHCKVTWNRDVNASRNILHIFQELRNGRGRPEAFLPRKTKGQRKGYAADSVPPMPLRGLSVYSDDMSLC